MNKRIKKKHKKQMLAKLELVESVMNDISTEIIMTHYYSPTVKKHHQEYVSFFKQLIENAANISKSTKQAKWNINKLKKAISDAYNAYNEPSQKTMDTINAYENIDFGILMHYLMKDIKKLKDEEDDSKRTM